MKQVEAVVETLVRSAVIGIIMVSNRVGLGVVPLGKV